MIFDSIIKVMEKYLPKDLINLIDEYSGKKQRDKLRALLNISEENFHKLTQLCSIHGNAVPHGIN